MNFKIIKTTAIILLLGLNAATYAEDKNNIVIKAGSFDLSSTNQTIISPVTFDAKSTSVFAIEYERNFGDDMSWGVEYISYENTFNSGASSASSSLILANFKKYFDASKSIKPFIGVGAGAAIVSLSGSGAGGSAGALGTQLMGGVKFIFKSVDAVLEYKLVSGEPEDAVGTTVDISGSGLFAGIAIKF